MTIRSFNRLLNVLPFDVAHQERIRFGGKTFKVGRLVNGNRRIVHARCRSSSRS
jgi:hypothetical protein